MARSSARYRAASGRATRRGRYDARYTTFSAHVAVAQNHWNNRRR
ncbi:hypothetical protein [Streptomyces sp. AFD10]